MIVTKAYPSDLKGVRVPTTGVNMSAIQWVLGAEDDLGFQTKGESGTKRSCAREVDRAKGGKGKPWSCFINHYDATETKQSYR